MNMALNTILFETDGPVAIVTLNRPKALNALNRELIGELDQVLEEIEKDSEIRAVIITGGRKAFAAGADLTEIIDITTPVQVRSYITNVQGVFNRIERLDRPVIAAVAGFAFGGGCELSLACDMRIAAGNAKFALPEIKLGLLPGAGGTQRLPRLIGAGLAKQHIFSGDPIDAQEAYRIGLVSKVVPTDSLLQEAMAMAKTLAQRPGFTLKTIKGLINEALDMPLGAALAHEMRCFEILFSTEDKKEGVAAFVEKRDPVFQNR
jgi:enoyl-CoA hydratase